MTGIRIIEQIENKLIEGIFKEYIINEKLLDNFEEWDLKIFRKKKIRIEINLEAGDETQIREIVTELSRYEISVESILIKALTKEDINLELILQNMPACLKITLEQHKESGYKALHNFFQLSRWQYWPMVNDLEIKECSSNLTEWSGLESENLNRICITGRANNLNPPKNNAFPNLTKLVFSSIPSSQTLCNWLSVNQKYAKKIDYIELANVRLPNGNESLDIEVDKKIQWKLGFNVPDIPGLLEFKRNQEISNFIKHSIETEIEYVKLENEYVHKSHIYELLNQSKLLKKIDLSEVIQLEEWSIEEWLPKKIANDSEIAISLPASLFMYESKISTLLKIIKNWKCKASLNVVDSNGWNENINIWGQVCSIIKINLLINEINVEIKNKHYYDSIEKKICLHITNSNSILTGKKLLEFIDIDNMEIECEYNKELIGNSFWSNRKLTYLKIQATINSLSIKSIMECMKRNNIDKVNLENAEIDNVGIQIINENIMLQETFFGRIKLSASQWKEINNSTYTIESYFKALSIALNKVN
jgi:hypothetical protein